MFGRRPDGRVVKQVDPIIQLTPYLMPQRCDAQVMLSYKLDYERLARFILSQRENGYSISFMELIIAAYVRAVAAYPELNRFVINKRLYARRELTTSFAMLKENDGKTDSFEENTCKVYFDPTDTIFDVSDRVHALIEQNRSAQADNFTLRLAKMLARPMIATPFVALVRLLDRYGLLPHAILDASPFHTGLFVTNMASIGMPAVKHHIYNFGNTSLFFSLGSIERQMVMTPEGKPKMRRILPVGVVADERICSGAMYANVLGYMYKHLSNPEMLLTPPETVHYDEGNEYHVEKPACRQHAVEEESA